MKRTKIFHILSFFVPALICFFVYMLYGIYPFGEKTLLIMDMDGQYIEFFSYLRNIFDNGGSIFFSWSKAMGQSLVGLFAYYLSSPFSWLIFLFPKDNLLEALYFLNVIKIGLAGLTFSFFLTETYKKNDISIVCFCVFYALMSYQIVYSMSLMWLDGVIFLPIIITGLHRIADGKSPILYISSFTVMIVANYYISYMIGIFSFLYFIYYSVVKHMSFKVFLRRAAVFALSAAACAGLTLWFTLPVLFDNFQGKINGFQYVFDWKTNFSFPDVFNKLVIGQYDSITNAGMPSVYCGAAVMLLVLAFAFSRRFSLRERGAGLIFSAVLFLGFYFTKIDFMWHVFQKPGWFPYRYAFVFSFLLITIAYRSFTPVNKLSVLSVITSAASTAAFLIFMLLIGVSEQEPIIITLILVALYCGLFLLASLKKNAGSSIFLAIILLASSYEMYTNARGLVEGLDRQFEYTNYSDYASFKNKISPFLPIITNASSRDFYRTENALDRTKNDGMGFGYNAITHYSSAYNSGFIELMKDLGFPNAFCWNAYYGSTMLTDAIFGVRYIMSPNKNPSVYKRVAESADTVLYENPYRLSIGFMTNEEALSLRYDKNPLKAQGDMLASMTGTETDYFYPANYETATEGDSVTYSFTAQAADPVYVFFPRGKAKEYGFFVNGTPNYFPPETLKTVFIGQFEKGESVEVRLEYPGSPDIENARFYHLSLSAFEEDINELKKSQLLITDIGAASIKGIVETPPERTVLFTTIPYDSGWKCILDGKEIKPDKFSGAFLSFTLTPGSHEISLYFVPKGMLPGLAVSAVTFLLICLLLRRRASL